MTARRQITEKHLSIVIDKNREIIELRSQLNKLREKSKGLWNELMRLNREVDRFDMGAYRHHDEDKQQEKIDNLERETKLVYDDYMKYGELEEDLQYTLQDAIQDIRDRHVIIPDRGNLVALYTYSPRHPNNRQSVRQRSSTSASGLYSNNSTRKRSKKNNKMKNENNKMIKIGKLIRM
mgnify:CR=1 FL=1